MRRLRSREALSPIIGQLALSLVLVVAAIVLYATGRTLWAVGALVVAFAVVGGAKRAR